MRTTKAGHLERAARKRKWKHFSNKHCLTTHLVDQSSPSPTINRPLVRFKQFFTQPQSEAEVRQLFSVEPHGLALLTYPASQLIVLDFDGKHASDAWKRTGFELSPTASNRTRSGGFHVIYQMPAEFSGPINRRVRLLEDNCDCKKKCGVDLLVNGYFVAPPTPGYSVEKSLDQIIEIPADTFKAILELAQRQSKPLASTATTVIPQGRRNDSLTSVAGVMRRKGMSYDSIVAALREENQAKCDPPLDDSDILKIATSISSYEPDDVPAHVNAKLLLSGNTNPWSAAVSLGELAASIPPAPDWLIRTFSLQGRSI